MAKTMNRTAQKEYLKLMRCRCRRHTGKAARSCLLDEFCEVTKHERKYAIKLLKAQRGPNRADGSKPKKRGRKSIYSAEAVAVLFAIWKVAEQPCGKRLRPMLKEWIPSYERKLGEDLSPELKAGVLAISPAQIDRVLAPKKVGVSRRARRTPKANAAMKKLIPIRAECWDAKSPGWLEADTVAHCGGDVGGSFVWNLTATDIFSGWTEVRPSWNRGQHNVCEAFKRIEADLPFTISGVDTDNGGEFLKYHLHRYFTDRESPVELSCSRPYHKNDQAHVEQKNSTHVRQLLGHDRLGHEQLMVLIFDLMEAWSEWRNCFTTSFKQLENRREGSKTIRRHEKVPQTPCDRLITYYREVGDERSAKALDAWRSLHDPFELKAWIEKKLRQTWKLDTALNEAENVGETDMERMAAPIVRRNLRSAPIAPHNRKRDSTFYTKKHPIKQPNQDATKSPKAA